jgi:hypothetical protein
MERFFLSLVLGLFARPAAPVPAVAPAPPKPVVSAPAAAAQVPGAPAVEQFTKPPVAMEAASAARKGARQDTEKDEGGKIRHRFVFADGTAVEFEDRPKRPRDQAKRERVVFFTGTESAAREPDASFEAAGRASGLAPGAVSALRFISRHEGGFDAINTWDRARFSWGFIQFAGGYGLRPVLAHFKSARPELFQKLLADYGVDVLPDEKGNPEPVFLDTATGKRLRGDDAEQAFGDNPLVIALFIRAGRVPEVKQVQLEAAIREYAAPALAATYESVKLSDVLRSPQGQAMLIDRKVQEGNVIRLEWALEHARIVNNKPNPADWPALEGQVLDLALQDADARSHIAVLAETAVAGLERAAAAAQNGQAQLVPDGPSLSGARAAIQQAIAEADYRMVVSYRRDMVRGDLGAALAATEPLQMQGCSPDTMGTRVAAAAAKVREIAERFRFEANIRDRLRNIRNSDLAGPRR